MVRYIDDLQLDREAGLHPGRLQRPADEQQQGHRRHAHPRGAADHRARAASGRQGHPRLAPGAAQGRGSRSCRSSRRRARCPSCWARTHEVLLADDCVGDGVRKMVKDLRDGQVLLLENLRFHKDEEANDEAFARQLAELADVYVNDAFGTAHRAHASTAGMVPFVKEKAAGLLMLKELEFLGGCSGRRAAVRGGARRRQGLGQDRGHREPAARVRRAAHRRRDGQHLPQGAGRRGRARAGSRRTSWRWRASCSRRRSGWARQCCCRSTTSSAPSPTEKTRSARGDGAGACPPELMGLDIGPQDARRCSPSTSAARKTVLWNGPMGVFEVPTFAAGTRAVAEAMAANSRARPRWWAAATARRRCTRSGLANKMTPRLDRRRRLARVPRGQGAARRGGARVLSEEDDDLARRRPLIAGNWKMHKTVAEAVALVRELAARSPWCATGEVVVAPPFTALARRWRKALEGIERRARPRRTATGRRRAPSPARSRRRCSRTWAAPT